MNSLRVLPLFLFINLSSCSLPDLNDLETFKETKQKAVSLSTINKEFKYGMVWLYVDENNESYTGWVKETHSNHSIKKLGYLKNGQKEGVWMDWYKNGLQESKIMIDDENKDEDRKLKEAQMAMDSAADMTSNMEGIINTTVRKI